MQMSFKQKTAGAIAIAMGLATVTGTTPALAAHFPGGGGGFHGGGFHGGFHGGMMGGGHMWHGGGWHGGGWRHGWGGGYYGGGPYWGGYYGYGYGYDCPWPFAVMPGYGCPYYPY
jgi:hypothetical protein